MKKRFREGLMRWMRAAFPVCVLAGCAGCALTPGLVPSMGGSVKEEVTIVDSQAGALDPRLRTNAVSSDDAHYSEITVRGKYPAGVEKKDRITADYQWSKNGKMSVNQEARLSTQGQANMNSEVASIAGEILPGIFEALIQGMIQALGVPSAGGSEGPSSSGSGGEGMTKGSAWPDAWGDVLDALNDINARLSALEKE